MKSVLPSTQTWPPPGQSICATSLVFSVFAILPRDGPSGRWCRRSSETDDFAGRSPAMLLIERQRLQRRLVAGDEQEDRFRAVIDVLAPGAARQIGRAHV